MEGAVNFSALPRTIRTRYIFDLDEKRHTQNIDRILSQESKRKTDNSYVL